jgi:hypothetical protein
MEKIKINSYWLKELPNDEFEETVELWVDGYNGVVNSGSKYKIMVWVEPEEFQQLRNEIIKHSEYFDYILTYDEVLLNLVNNAVLLEYGTSWIDWVNHEFTKEFNISTVCGNKRQLPGHRLRHVLWNRQNEIKTPKKFFYSKGAHGLKRPNTLELVDGKEEMFNSMFHICIENVSKNYFFTEKLIDSFVTKTIPIYLGCPNIGNYFNTKGMFIVDNINDMISICNNITEEDYKNRLPYIEENYEKAVKLADYRGNITKKIKELIE